MADSIRIVATPDGPAPQWVRERWIGLQLPVAKPTPVTNYCFKDFRPRGPAWPWSVAWWFATGKLERWTGYLVNVDEAWRVLDIRHSDAAAWWRENAPHLIGTAFIFPLASCEPQ